MRWSGSGSAGDGHPRPVHRHRVEPVPARRDGRGSFAERGGAGASSGAEPVFRAGDEYDAVDVCGAVAGAADSSVAFRIGPGRVRVDQGGHDHDRQRAADDVLRERGAAAGPRLPHLAQLRRVHNPVTTPQTIPNRRRIPRTPTTGQFPIGSEGVTNRSLRRHKSPVQGTCDVRDTLDRALVLHLS